MFATTIAVAALALSVAAQDSSTSPSPTASATKTANGDVQTTITGLVGTFTSGFAASVVSANPCETTLAMHCTDTENLACSLASDVEINVTQGPSTYEVVYSTSTLGGSVSISQGCSLNGPSGSASELVCTASFLLSAEGTSTASKTTQTLTNSDEYNYAQIPITAGAEKLPSAGATCSATSTQHAGAASTAMSEVYKVIVPVAGALVAGALL